MTALAGLGPLTRLALRRDRLMIGAWVAALTVVAYASVDATRKLYPTAALRSEFAAGAGASKATIAIYGPSADLHTLGGLATWKLNALGAVLAAVMSIVIVVRHTRGDEDAGRLELVGAGAVGRPAALTAALVTAFAANLGLALLVATGMAAAGLPPLDSLAYGLALAGAGWAFSALAALAAQAAGTARTAAGSAAAVLGLAYLLRAVGDTAHRGTWTAGLSWLSPIGWAERVRPFGPQHWWVLSMALGLTLVAALGAYILSRRRDLGSGLFPARPGPAVGGISLRGPFGLAWRLQRGVLTAWVAGFALYGLFIGALADTVGTLVGSSTGARELFLKLGGHAMLVDSFFAAMMTMMGVLASVYSVSAALRLRAEETGDRAEPVLATPLSRLRWALGHLVLAVAGPAVLLVVAGLAAGSVHGGRTADIGGALPRVLAAALVQVPAVWVLTGLAVLAFGLLPRMTGLAWAAIVGSLLLTEFGPLLGLSQWVMDLSPFTHVPRLPGAAFSAAPLLWLTAVAVGLGALGLAGLRRRDLG